MTTCIDDNRFNIIFPQPFNNNTSCKTSVVHGNQMTDIQSATAKFAQLSFETQAMTTESQTRTKKLQFSGIPKDDVKRKSLKELTQEANHNIYTLAFLKKPMTEQRFCNQYLPYLVESGCDGFEERIKQYYIFLFQEAIHRNIENFFNNPLKKTEDIDDFMIDLTEEIKIIENEKIELTPPQFYDKLEIHIRCKEGKKLFPTIKEAGDSIRLNYKELSNYEWHKDEKRIFNLLEFLEFDNRFVPLYMNLGAKLIRYITNCDINNYKMFKTKIEEMFTLTQDSINNAPSALPIKEFSPFPSNLSKKKEIENQPIKTTDIIALLLKNLNLYDSNLEPKLKLDKTFEGHIENLIGEAIFNLEAHQMEYADEQDFFNVICFEISIILTDSKHLKKIGIFDRTYKEHNNIDIKNLTDHYNTKVRPLLMKIDMLPNSILLKQTIRKYLEQKTLSKTSK